MEASHKTHRPHIKVGKDEEKKIGKKYQNRAPKPSFQLIAMWCLTTTGVAVAVYVWIVNKSAKRQNIWLYSLIDDFPLYCAALLMILPSMGTRLVIIIITSRYTR